VLRPAERLPGAAAPRPRGDDDAVATFLNSFTTDGDREAFTEGNGRALFGIEDDLG